MRSSLCLALLILASGVHAQDTPPEPPDPVPLMQVLSVMQQGSSYVYDLDGWDERMATLVTGGFLVVRAPNLPAVKVILEPAGPLAATDGPNAVEVTPGSPVGFLRARRFDFRSERGYTEHVVTVLVCTEPGYPSCDTWTAAEPLDGAGDLRLRIVDLEPRGDEPYYVPAPMPDRANPDDD